MANSHVRIQPDVESLGIMTGAGGAIYINVPEDVANVGDCTPSAASIQSAGGDSAYVIFSLGSLIIRKVTVLVNDGDGNAIILLTSADTDVDDTLIAQDIPTGTSIYGKWTAGTVGVSEGISLMLYTESRAD